MSSADPEGHLQIGLVAERTEVSIRTLRHWEEVGLITPSARSTGGFRLYTERDVERLLKVRRMKPLGFTLDEMKELLAGLDVLADPGADVPRRQAAVELVATYHDRAQESCRYLRKQLAYAVEFKDLLADTAGLREADPEGEPPAPAASVRTSGSTA